MSSEIDPMQITVAVFDRMVDKFKDVLEVRELDPMLIRDGLKTLNELVHHQVSFLYQFHFELGNG
jgi:hypothetical protein